MKQIGISKHRVRKLMKDQGVKIASKEAVRLLREYLECITIDITWKALKLAEHAKRKKITIKDLKLAIGK